MRKNIYNDNIIMLSYSELLVSRTSIFITLDESAIFDLYLDEIRAKYSDTDKIFGFMKDDKVVKIISSILSSYYYEHCTISHKSIRNAFLYSVMTGETSIKLKDALINYNSECIAEFIRIYGEDTFEYIIQHKDYSYEDNTDKVTEIDKCVYLCHDGKIEQVQLGKNQSILQSVTNNSVNGELSENNGLDDGKAITKGK